MSQSGSTTFCQNNVFVCVILPSLFRSNMIFQLNHSILWGITHFGINSFINVLQPDLTTQYFLKSYEYSPISREKKIRCRFLNGFKGTVMQIDGTDKWSHTWFKRILKISQSSYLQLCSNLTVKFSIFVKSTLFSNSFCCLFQS